MRRPIKFGEDGSRPVFGDEPQGSSVTRFFRDRWDFLVAVVLGSWDYAREKPFHAAAAAVILASVSFAAWDIWEGEWVTHEGRVTGHTWSIESHTVCDSKDKQGNCTSSHTETETFYYLFVRHQGMNDKVRVTWYEYSDYADGEAVLISYRNGGVFHLHWFASVKKMPAEKEWR